MQIEKAKITKLIMDFEQSSLKNRPCSVHISGNILTPKDTDNDLCFVFLTVRLRIEEGTEFFNLTVRANVHYKSDETEDIKRKKIQQEAFPIVYANLRDLYERLCNESAATLPRLPSLEDLDL